MSLIEAQNVTVRFEGKEVLSGVDLRIDRGEIVTIVGPNGSGKTTLLRTLIGAIRPVSGAIETAPGLRVGYVPQRLHISTTLPITVGRFISLPHRVAKKVRDNALAEAGVPDHSYRQMSSLSGGQFQRVLLARALIDEPDILLLDEATQGLDQPGSAAFYRQIETVRSSLGCAVLLISHDLHVVMSASDRVVCLNGHVCCEGTPEVVSSAPAYRALFGSGTMGAMALYRHEHSHHHATTEAAD